MLLYGEVTHPLPPPTPLYLFASRPFLFISLCPSSPLPILRPITSPPPSSLVLPLALNIINLIFYFIPFGVVLGWRGVRALSYSFKYTLSCIASIALIISAMLLPISHVEILF